MKVFILAAGKGTRLSTIWPHPKILFPIAGRSLLLRQYDFFSRITDPESITFVLSWKSEEVVAHIVNHNLSCRYVVVPFSDTGSELVEATRGMDQQEPYMVVNGDTLTDIDLIRFETEYRQRNIPTLLAITPWPDTSARGRIAFDAGRGLATKFHEKTGVSEPGHINAGLYILTRQCLEGYNGVFSLERDVFPDLAESRKLGVFIHDGYVLDCGTPERIQRAKRILA